jgi:hypothetical protein
MTTFTELKIEYQDKIRQAEDMRIARDEEIQAKQKAVLDNLFPAVCEFLAGYTGADISEFKLFGKLEGNWRGNTGLNSIVFHLNIPDHFGLSTVLNQVDDLSKNTTLKWRVDQYNSFDNLGEALDCAAKSWWRQAEEEIREAEYMVEKEAQRRKKATAKVQEDDKLRSLFDQVSGDPVAVTLLNLFTKIQADRNTLTGQIEEIERAYSNAEYYHGEAESAARRKADDAQREAAEARRLAESVRYEVDEMEAKFKKAQRSW